MKKITIKITRTELIEFCNIITGFIASQQSDEFTITDLLNCIQIGNFQIRLYKKFISMQKTYTLNLSIPESIAILYLNDKHFDILLRDIAGRIDRQIPTSIKHIIH